MKNKLIKLIFHIFFYRLLLFYFQHILTLLQYILIIKKFSL